MTDVFVAFERDVLSFCFDESQKAILSNQEECVHTADTVCFFFVKLDTSGS